MPELQGIQKGGLKLLKKTMMYGEGKGRQHLRDYIINKRASEGLEDIPDDLFANRPRHEMSEDERRNMMERRKRNKEAAERSRKKKKVEFEKLQGENDQLNQDKCELVAMVQKLKGDCDNLTSENDLMRTSLEHLKRWIGKRSWELGLTRYAPEKGGVSDKEIISLTDAHAHQLANESEGGGGVTEHRVAESGHPPSSSSPKRRRLSGGGGQPSPRPQLQSPWSVEPVRGKGTHAASGANTSSGPPPVPQAGAHLAEKQPVILAKKVIYLPKDTVVVLGGGAEKGAIVAREPECRPLRKPSPQIGVEPPEARSLETSRMIGGMAGLDLPHTPPPTTAATAPAATVARDEQVKGGVLDTSGMDPAKATAIESLLKLGCKIQLPDIIQGRNGDL
ncbi:hypothetical protein ACOMHN_051623 [Nucella lapillus]